MAACEIVNCNGVEVQCQVPILPVNVLEDSMDQYNDLPSYGGSACGGFIFLC